MTQFQTASKEALFNFYILFESFYQNKHTAGSISVIAVRLQDRMKFQGHLY